MVLLLLALPGGSAFVKHHNFSAELPRWHWHTHDEVGEAVASLAGNHSLGMHLPQENHELLVHGMTQAISALRSADTALHTFREEAAPDGEAVPPEAVAHAHVMLELRHLEGNQARHGVLSKQQVGHEAFFKGAGKAVLGVLKTVWKRECLICSQLPSRLRLPPPSHTSFAALLLRSFCSLLRSLLQRCPIRWCRSSRTPPSACPSSRPT